MKIVPFFVHNLCKLFIITSFTSDVNAFIDCGNNNSDIFQCIGHVINKY